MPSPSCHPDSLLEAALRGDHTQLGELLDSYRNYLSVLAKIHLDSGVSARVDASDIVQETYLEAQRDFKQFQGHSEAQLIGWLRKILIRNLTDEHLRQTAQKRDWRRQRSLEASFEQSSIQLRGMLTGGLTSPSAQAVKKEQEVLLANALSALPDDYQEVILLRNLKALPFGQIAVKMRRTPAAARMLWVRALERLRRELGD